MEITISLTVSDYKDIKFTGNPSNINNALKEINEIVLHKNLSSNHCTYGPDCKFQHKNNIEMKAINNPMEIFIFTFKNNAEIASSSKAVRRSKKKRNRKITAK